MHDESIKHETQNIDVHLLSGIVIDELVRNNIRNFLYCPGSRNGPIGFELARRAYIGDLELHVRLDERVAAFTALGMAKATSSPVVVITTSGSAVTNLLPAVTEANYSNVPVIILSANRPLNALGSGASQTIEQIEILSSQVRTRIQLAPEITSVTDINSSIRSLICRGVLTSLGYLATSVGPIHFDIPLNSALPPTQFDLGIPEGKPNGASWVSSHVSTNVQKISEPYQLHPHSIVIAGDGAEADNIPSGVPVVAEPTVSLRSDQLRLHPWTLDYILPEEVLIIGRPTLHRNVLRIMHDSHVRISFLGNGTEQWLYNAQDLDTFVTSVAPPAIYDSDWVEEIFSVNHKIRQLWHEKLLDTITNPGGIHVVNVILNSISADEILWLGASNTIRDAALVASDFPHKTLSNRGVAGIDGTIASAIGVALAYPEQQVVAVLGDLTFLYDATALQFGEHEFVPKNLTIVIINDQGGGIFELLEQGATKYKEPPYAMTFERIYGTPQNATIAHLCQAYGVRYRVVPLIDLQQTLKEEHRQGLSVIEVHAERGSLRGIHASVRESINFWLQGQATSP